MSDITISGLLKLNNPNIIDIRSIEKYNSNHIPNAIHILYDNLVLEPYKHLDKNKLYYIYCGQGIKSAKLCTILRRKGYRVINIIGGYEAWILEDK